MEEPPDCIVLGDAGVRHGEVGVVAGVHGVEGVVHGDGLVRPVARSGVDLGLSNSGLRFGAAAASKAGSQQQTAGATWSRLPLPAVGMRLHVIPWCIFFLFFVDFSRNSTLSSSGCLTLAAASLSA